MRIIVRTKLRIKKSYITVGLSEDLLKRKLFSFNISSSINGINFVSRSLALANKLWFHADQSLTFAPKPVELTQK